MEQKVYEPLPLFSEVSRKDHTRHVIRALRSGEFAQIRDKWIDEQSETGWTFRGVCCEVMRRLTGKGKWGFVAGWYSDVGNTRFPPYRLFSPVHGSSLASEGEFNEWRRSGQGGSFNYQCKPLIEIHWEMQPWGFFFIPNAFVAEWQLDLSGNPTPVWNRVEWSDFKTQPFTVTADVLEAALETHIPDRSLITTKVTGKANKNIGPGGLPPFRALEYA